MHSHRLVFGMTALLAAVATTFGGCAKKDAGTGAGATPGAAQASMAFRNEVSFRFTDVRVTTSGPTIMRLEFAMHNNSNDTVLCDPSEFTVKLSDGSVVAADASAEDTCTPDSIDPGQTGSAVMFFDLATSYTGPIELSMAGTNAIIGRGTTTIK
jgi:hypothetical protein